MATLVLQINAVGTHQLVRAQTILPNETMFEQDRKHSDIPLLM